MKWLFGKKTKKKLPTFEQMLQRMQTIHDLTKDEAICTLVIEVNRLGNAVRSLEEKLSKLSQ